MPLENRKKSICVLASSWLQGYNGVRFVDLLIEATTQNCRQIAIDFFPNCILFSSFFSFLINTCVRICLAVPLRMLQEDLHVRFDVHSALHVQELRPSWYSRNCRESNFYVLFIVGVSMDIESEFSCPNQSPAARTCLRCLAEYTSSALVLSLSMDIFCSICMRHC